MEKAIRDELHMFGSALTTEDLKNVITIEVIDQQIRDTSVLKYCTNLRTLSLVNCGLNSVPDLAGADDIEYLDLSWNKIESIKSFPTLRSLEYIDLHQNPLFNLSGLMNLNSSCYIDLAEFDADQDMFSNDEVRQIQALLIEKNYLYDLADGQYGPRTSQAIRELQKDAGLEPTGAVDQKTIRALIEQPDRAFEPAQANHCVIYNAYVDAEGFIYVRIKNTGRKPITRVRVGGQQLRYDRSVLGSLSGDWEGKNRYTYHLWTWVENPFLSGTTKRCYLSDSPGFHIFRDTVYGQLWLMDITSESGAEISFFSKERAPVSTVYFSMHP